MRNAFITELEKIAKVNKRITLLTGDLGFTVFENFQKEFPERFFNVGVAESNMIGIGSGLVLSGFIPVIYSIATFVTMRGYEQIRDDIGYHNSNVKIIGTGGGLSYGHAGFTHHSLEDIALMRIIPNMSVVCPGDPYSARVILREIIKHAGPVYFRLGKKGEPAIYQSNQKIRLGKGIILKEGKDVAIIATGNIVYSAFQSSKILEAKDISSTVVDMHTVKPIDKDLIIELAKKVKLIVTVEEHFINGGLGSAIAELLAESNHKIKFKRIGIEDKFIDRIGSQEYLRLAYHLDPESIARTILQMI